MQRLSLLERWFLHPIARTRWENFIKSSVTELSRSKQYWISKASRCTLLLGAGTVWKRVQSHQPLMTKGTGILMSELSQVGRVWLPRKNSHNPSTRRLRILGPFLYGTFFSFPYSFGLKLSYRIRWLMWQIHSPQNWRLALCSTVNIVHRVDKSHETFHVYGLLAWYEVLISPVYVCHFTTVVYELWGYFFQWPSSSLIFDPFCILDAKQV